MKRLVLLSLFIFPFAIAAQAQGDLSVESLAPVSLEAGKTYAIWFNSPNGRHNAFRDRGNHPAIPYLLVFQIRD